MPRGTDQRIEKMSGRAYTVVDAFTSRAFEGNPAAVILDATGMTDAAMQRIAAEFNLSETTFILPPDDPAAADVRFRWFTPAVEATMCGHATIAGVHALLEAGMYAQLAQGDGGVLRIQTLSGVLETAVEALRPGGEGRILWLELPTPRLEAFALPDRWLTEGLRIGVDELADGLPPMRTQERDVILFVKRFTTLQDIRPDFSRLVELGRAAGVRGLHVGTTNTLSPSIHVHTRFFAPAVGIDEDPVTGSAHGPLLAYLVAHGRVEGREGLVAAQCAQGIPGGRSGLVRVLGRVEGGRLVSAQIGGEAVSVMHGELHREP